MIPTPKEKAEELLCRMYLACDDIECHHSIKENMKKCALIAVDEILNTEISDTVSGHDYWQEVKQEIEKL